MRALRRFLAEKSNNRRYRPTVIDPDLPDLVAGYLGADWPSHRGALALD
ncbi:MAG: hypothetical protein ACRDTC_22525 [Pseudonocardiaceae bacterium]